MSIHIPENTDISGLGRTPKSGKRRSVGATRARRNPVFTVLDFIPPERRCLNGQIISAYDKCLEDYQISPPGQARKAEFGIGGLSKSFLHIATALNRPNQELLALIILHNRSLILF